jgi:hypothetical protein
MNSKAAITPVILTMLVWIMEDFWVELECRSVLGLRSGWVVWPGGVFPDFE